MPLQIIFTRSTMRCHPQNNLRKASCLGARFHLTYFANRWSTLKTCQQFVERILIPYHKNEVHELNLPQNQKMVWLIDWRSIHKSMEFIQWIKSQHPHVYLVLIPIKCTSRLQLANVMIQHPFKHVFKKQFHMWTSCTIKDQLLKEKDPKVDFRMSTIKLKLCG